MRVLHVAQPTTAGVARVVLDLVRDQLGRGWRVVVASPADGDLREAVLGLGGSWLSWPAGRSPGRSTPGEVLRLRGVVDTTAPDVVHLHSSKAGLAGRLALRGRIPTVFQPHAWSFQAVEGAAAALAARWEVAGARWAHAVAVVSPEEQAAGEAAGIRARWVHLPNGIDLSRRSPTGPTGRAAARRELGLAEGPLAVCVGRLCRQKGQDVLLEAWHEVARETADASLVLVGDGPDRDVLARAAPQGVRIVGDVRDPDPWLRAADVVVLPSRWEAGLSLVAMEAMALSRTVVTTGVAGAVEGIGGGAGAVVAVADAPARAPAGRARLASPALAAAEGAEGRRRVEQHHDVVATTARTAQLYGRLLER